MNIPESMQDELGAWNNGQGVDLETYISCTGNFSLAVGYSTIFCPQFVEFEDYIIQANEVDDQLIQSIRSFESSPNSTPQSVEWVINHLHIADIQHHGCEDLSLDKILILGESLKQIYEARLNFIFPNKPCTVEFYKPENTDDLYDYQLSFWQKKHEG